MVSFKWRFGEFLFPVRGFWASQVVLVVQNRPASAGDVRDAGLIPGSGRSLEKEMAIHSSILAWRIPWTEQPGGLQSIGSQSRTRLKQFSTYMCTSGLYHGFRNIYEFRRSILYLFILIERTYDLESESWLPKQFSQGRWKKAFVPFTRLNHQLISLRIWA